MRSETCPGLAVAAFLLSFFVLTNSACSEKEAVADYNIIPLPHTIELAAENNFVLDKNTGIVCMGESEDSHRNASFLADYIMDAMNFRPVISLGAELTGVNSIVLQQDTTITDREAYRLDITPDRIVVSGGSDAGVFYGIQTLRKSMPATVSGKVLFPAGTVTDAPYISYRGFMLDAARSFYTVDQVKKYIDLLPLHNLNVFHWHLTDDQGWRIEIKKYPELIETGSMRADTCSAGTYGGYYTQEDILDVVEYARQRYIEVIPEIDMPGHMLAALASYPELGCTGGPYKITSQPGVRKDILCAGNDKTMAFVKDVLAEVVELFPSQYIHIGGDEAPRDRWAACSKCQARIRANGLRTDSHSSAEAKLQSWFNHEVEVFLKEKGRRIIGWDEIIEGGLSADATVMSWRGTKGGIVAARDGRDVIMTPNSALYFDYMQSSNMRTEPPSIGGYVPLKKVYDYEPVPEELTPEQARHIIGVQANAWTPYMREFASLQYMTLPRLAGLSEIAWSGDIQRNFVKFLDRLDHLCEFYDRDGYTYRKHFFDIQASFVPDYATRSVNMTLTSLETATIYYTLDGTTPSEESSEYTGPVNITDRSSVRAVAYLPDGRASEIFEEEITINKATFMPLTLLADPAPKFSNPGLNDGVRGKEVYTFGNWTGFEHNDLTAVVDLESPTEISKVAITALLDYGSHISDAAGMTVWVSDNGEDFTQVADADYPEVPYQAVKALRHHELTFGPLTTRYVKVEVRRASQLPAEQFDSRIQPFLFVDEILVD